MKLHFGRAVLAGLTGTALMTVFMWMAPLMGLPPMNIGRMLGSVLGGSEPLGWIAHFAIGTVLAVIYAAVCAARLPGSGVARGAVYSLAPWLMAQLAVMPMMGMGLFSGSAVMAAGSLVAHLVYGAALGGLYGTPQRDSHAVRPLVA